MKVVTIDSIEWQESPNYYEGRTQDVKAIVIHWWGDPATNPTMNGVISHFKNSAAEVSAHFVVSGDRVVQMVNMGDTAWHARQANPFTVGIEVDPKTPGNTYETVGALVRFIRTFYGNIPLKKHSEYVATSCCGTVSLTKIDDYAYGRIATPAPVVNQPVQTSLYRVFVGTTQLGAYSVEQNAYEAFKTRGGTKITLNGNDVTAQVVAKYAPAPQPAPVPTVSEKDKAQDQVIADVNSKLSNLSASVDKIVAFLTSIFSGFKK